MSSAMLLAAEILLGVALSPASQPIEPPPRPGNGISAPTVIDDWRPGYTPDALALGIEGSVALECVVEADGSVADVRIVRALEPSLDAAAVAALKKWRFKPGMKDGTPVRVLVDVEMTFGLGENEPRLDSSDVFKVGPGVTAPTVLKEVKPEFPAAQRGFGIQGNVTLDCVVRSDGRVGHTRVTRSLNPDLDREAIRALRQWRFKPGQRQGKPVPVQVSVEIYFTLK